MSTLEGDLSEKRQKYVDDKLRGPHGPVPNSKILKSREDSVSSLLT
jgi:hypothetical protein